MTSKKIIITRPEHDDITVYLSTWAEEIIELARSQAIELKDLWNESATRSEFEKYLIKQNPTLVFINGHGEDDHVCGYKNECLLKEAENDELMKGRIIYCLACNCGSRLGYSLVNSGQAKAFIGYRLPFGFVANNFKTCVPEDDEFANYFKEASNEVPISLIKGRSISTAFKKSQDKFRELIRKLGGSQSLPEAKEIRFWLFWDMRAQVKIGDDQASF